MTQHESDNGVDDRVDGLLRSSAAVTVEPDARFLQRLRCASADAFAMAAAEATQRETTTVDAARATPGPRHHRAMGRRWPVRAGLAAAAAVVLALSLWALHSASPA